MSQLTYSLSHTHTGAFGCSTGVRQGCVISSSLFQCFINELVLEMEKECPAAVQLHPDVIHILLLLFAVELMLSVKLFSIFQNVKYSSRVL